MFAQLYTVTLMTLILPWEFINYSGHQGVHASAECFPTC